MATPAPPSEDWAALPNGLIVKASLVKGREQRALAQVSRAEAQAKGRFFSNWGMRGYSPGGAQEKPRETPSFGFLREVASRSPVDQIIIMARKAQVENVSRRVIIPRTQVGWRVVHERFADPDFAMTHDIRERCLEMEHIVENVAKWRHANFSRFISSCVEEEMILDRKAMIVERGRLSHLPVAYYMQDGAYIKTRAQVLMPFMMKQGINEEEIGVLRLSEVSGIDLFDKAYVQEIDGQVVGAWTKDQCYLDIRDQRIEIDKSLYGRSMLERSLEVTTAIVTAWNFNQKLFAVNYPEAILAIYGDYDEQGLEEFKRQIMAETGPGGPYRLPILPADPDFRAELLKLRDTPTDMLFGEWLARVIALKCAAYRMHPSTINWSEEMGAKGITFENKVEEIEEAKEDGLHGFLQNFAAWITETLIRPRYADLIFWWEGLSRQAEDARMKNLVQAAGPYMCIDEARAMDNLPPSKPMNQIAVGDVIANQMVVQYTQQVQMAQQMQAQQGAVAAAQQQQMPPGYDQGNFGAEAPGQPTGAPAQPAPVAPSAPAAPQAPTAGVANKAGERDTERPVRYIRMRMSR